MSKHVAVTTQSEHPWRATIRTAFAALVALAAMAPAIYAAATLQSPEAAGGAALAVLTIAGGLTRVMALPGVEAFLQRFVPWLAAAPSGEVPPTVVGKTEAGRLLVRDGSGVVTPVDDGRIPMTTADGGRVRVRPEDVAGLE